MLKGIKNAVPWGSMGLRLVGSSNSIIGEAAPLQLGQMLLESVQHTGQAWSLEQTAQVQEIGTETLVFCSAPSL